MFVGVAKTRRMLHREPKFHQACSIFELETEVQELPKSALRAVITSLTRKILLTAIQPAEFGA